LFVVKAFPLQPSPWNPYSQSTENDGKREALSRVNAIPLWSDPLSLSEKFRRIIIANELGGDLSEALKFSDPDGVRSGKSGWSFGVCQFDLQNNSLAAACLRECGLTTEEIEGLISQTVDPRPLEPKLQAAADIVSRYDDIQLKACVERAHNLLDRFKIVPADDAALLSVADYDNQYGLSAIAGPKYLLGYLSLKGTFTAQDVLDFKLTGTKWGREHPEDCRRRHKNVVKIGGQGIATASLAKLAKDAKKAKPTGGIKA
jgi:hypothetical protein